MILSLLHITQQHDKNHLIKGKTIYICLQRKRYQNN